MQSIILRISLFCGLIGAICFLGFLGQAWSDSLPGTTSPSLTDVEAKVNKYLAGLGAQTLTHLSQTNCTDINGNPPRAQHYKCATKITNAAPLTAGDIRIIGFDPVSFDDPVGTELTARVDSERSGFQNCSAESKSGFVVNLRVVVKRTASAVILKTLAHTSSAQFNFSWKVTNSLAIDGNAEVAEAGTVIKTDADGEGLVVTRAATVTLDLPAHSAVALELATSLVSYVTTLHAVAIVDADLSRNDNKKYIRLSDVASEDNRKFSIEGVLTATDASPARGSSWYIPFDPTLCSPTASDAVEPIPIPVGPQPTGSTAAKVDWVLWTYGPPKEDEQPPTRGPIS